MSGPLLDRIDIALEIPAVRERDLARQAASLFRTETEAARRRIGTARAAQAERARAHGVGALNARLTAAEFACAAPLAPALQARLFHAIEVLGLSARGVHRTWRLARTLADLTGEPRVGPAAIDEALTMCWRGPAPATAPRG